MRIMRSYKLWCTRATWLKLKKKRPLMAISYTKSITPQLQPGPISLTSAAARPALLRPSCFASSRLFLRCSLFPAADSSRFETPLPFNPQCILHPCYRGWSPRAATAGAEPSLVRAVSVSVRLLALPFLPQRVRTGGKRRVVPSQP